MDPLTIALVAGGVGLLFLSGKKRKRVTAPTIPTIPTGPTKEPDQPKEGPKAGSDQQTLSSLGYSNSAEGVRQFQRDFNAVKRVFNIWDRYLVVDGVVGTNTRGAFQQAIDAAKKRNTTWKNLVKQAYDALKEYELTANDKGNLESLGYKIDTGVVFRFQRDWNLVNVKVAEMLPLTLAEDGLIGPLTRNAISAAQDLQNSRATAWQMLVAQAKGAA